MKLAIIGFGAFGQLAAMHLRKKCKVMVHDARAARLALARKIGFKTASLREACACDTVLICVPISSLEGLLLRMRKFLKPPMLVLDVCSVKVLPCKLFKKLLPKGVEAIGSHPLFGPQSAAKGCNGLQVVLCPVRCSSGTLSRVKKLLRSIGLKVVVMTPSEHDKLVAKTQATFHFLAKVLVRTGFTAVPFPLPSVRKIQEVVRLVKDDSPRLFKDMQVLNPFAARERAHLLKELKAIDGELK